MLTLLLPIML